jgi:hypothetical protein
MEYSVQDLIDELKKVEDKKRQVSIVVGNEDENSMDTWEFEIHHLDDTDHPLELFVNENAPQYA